MSPPAKPGAYLTELGALVQRCPVGCGFLVTDIPVPTSHPGLTVSPDDTRLALWWQLAACAEVLTAPVDIVLSRLPPASTLGPLLRAGDHRPAVLAELGLAMDPGQLSVLLCGLPDPDWQELLQLLAVHRRLRTLAATLTIPLWELADEYQRS